MRRRTLRPQQERAPLDCWHFHARNPLRAIVTHCAPLATLFVARVCGLIECIQKRAFNPGVSEEWQQRRDKFGAHCSMMGANAFSLALRSNSRSRRSSCHEGSAIIDCLTNHKNLLGQTFQAELESDIGTKLGSSGFSCLSCRLTLQLVVALSRTAMGRVLLKVRAVQSCSCAFLRTSCPNAGHHPWGQRVRPSVRTWGRRCSPLTFRTESARHHS
jgi:hypothetical protein